MSKPVSPIVSEYMSQIGSKGGKAGSRESKVKAGQSRSLKKQRAARLNGKLGGRPPIPVVEIDNKLAIKKSIYRSPIES